MQPLLVCPRVTSFAIHVTVTVLSNIIIMYMMVCSFLLQVVIQARENRFKEKQLRSLTEDLTKTHQDQLKHEHRLGKNVQSSAYTSRVGGVSERERIAETSMTSNSEEVTEDPSTTGSSSYGHSGTD